MWSLCTILSCLIFTFLQAWTVSSKCVEKTGLEGTIADKPSVYYTTYEKCWTIRAPVNQYIKLKINTLDLLSFSCGYAYLRISINETNENYKYCYNDANRKPVTASFDVDIYFYFREPSGTTRYPSLNINYTIQDFNCARKESFHCTNHSCIPKSQVCDGVKNCENGADELACGTGVGSISGVAEARMNAIAWLKSKRTPSWGWNENTPRAVTALFLADGANFNGTDLEEELMAKQTALKTSTALLKNSLPNEQLSMFINGLLVTCHSPRYFYGQNLVKILKDQVEASSGFVHPLVYLTLCNANETWPQRAYTDLNKILISHSEYPFFKDIQAFSVMAVSSYDNNTEILNKTELSHLKKLSKKIVENFKEHQLSDGSFGNAQTTSLVTQALFASGHEHDKDWKLNATIKYLIKELNSTHIDFLNNYLTLPILNGKSLSDIARVNCSANPRKHGEDDLVSGIKDYTGPMMRIQYSLFVGDDKDVIHTISLKVPENYTAYELMQVAEVEDYKYKFEWKRISGKMYVYKIGKVTNDPEVGKFWFLYLGSMNSTEAFSHSASSPDQLILSDKDHLVMWYEKAY